MSREFKPEERAAVISGLKDMFGSVILSGRHVHFAQLITSHLTEGHGYTAQEAIKLFTEMEAEAIRGLADKVEETTVEFLHQLRATT